MATFVHTYASFSEILADLKSICKELEDVCSTMQAEGVAELAVDGEKGQVMGRVAVHGFVSDAKQRLRRELAERQLKRR